MFLRLFKPQMSYSAHLQLFLSSLVVSLSITVVKWKTFTVLACERMVVLQRIILSKSKQMLSYSNIRAHPPLKILLISPGIKIAIPSCLRMRVSAGRRMRTLRRKWVSRTNVQIETQVSRKV